jgi:hypothetical protein
MNEYRKVSFTAPTMLILCYRHDNYTFEIPGGSARGPRFTQIYMTYVTVYM